MFKGAKKAVFKFIIANSYSNQGNFIHPIIVNILTSKMIETQSDTFQSDLTASITFDIPMM